MRDCPNRSGLRIAATIALACTALTVMRADGAGALATDAVPGAPDCARNLMAHAERAPDALAVSRDGLFVAISEPRPGGLDIVRRDLATGAAVVVESRAGTNLRTTSVDISDDGGVIVASVVDDAAVVPTTEQLIHDMTSGVTTVFAHRPEALVALSGDGQVVAIGSSGVLSTYEPGSNTTVDRIVPQGDVLGVDISRSGRYVVYASSGTGVSTTVLDRHEPVALPAAATTVPDVGHDLRISDDGSKLFDSVTDGSGRATVRAIGFPGGPVQTFTPSDPPLSRLDDVSGDGRYLLASGGVARIRIDTTDGSVVPMNGPVEKQFGTRAGVLTADGSGAVTIGGDAPAAGPLFRLDLVRPGLPAASIPSNYLLAGDVNEIQIGQRYAVSAVQPPPGLQLSFDLDATNVVGTLTIPPTDAGGYHTVRLVGPTGCVATRVVNVLALPFAAVAPQRVLDTRPATAVSWSGPKPAAGEIVHVVLPVPRLSPDLPDEQAVLVNVTATEATEAGFVTVYDCVGFPPTSNVNVARGGTAANLSVVILGSASELCLYTQGGAHLVVDLDGVMNTFLTPPSSVRLLDTRPETQQGYVGTEPAAGSTVAVTLPTNVHAAVLNVTGVDAIAPGYVTVYPCGTPRPTASNLNLVPGVVTANLVAVMAGTDDKVCIYSQSGTHLVVDLQLRANFHQFDGTVPQRLLDTRSASRIGFDGPEPSAGQTVAVAMPSGQRAAIFNLTGTGAEAPGFVTAYPCGTARPTSSNLNLTPGAIATNLVVVAPGADGKVCLYTQSAANLIVDLAGTA